MKVLEININEIKIPRGNVRKTLDEKTTEKLAKSISEIGLINPISVKKTLKGFELIAGQRRLSAFGLLQKNKIPAIIFDVAEEIGFGMQVQENIQRDAVNAIDEGHAYGIALRKFGISQKKLAELIGKSESYVADRIATLKYFPTLLRALKAGKISFSVAREFAKIESKSDLDRYLDFAENGGINPKLARKWVKEYKLNNKQVERIEIYPDGDDEHEINPNNKMMTGCHTCSKAVDLHLVRHLNLCPECYELIMNP